MGKNGKKSKILKSAKIMFLCVFVHVWAEYVILGEILGKLRSGPVCRLRRRSVVVATLLQVCVASLRSARLINAFGDYIHLFENYP